MPITHANSQAASAIRSLRVKALLDEVPKTKIARQLGTSRQTVAKRLKAKDMPLSEFIAISELLGVSAGEVLELADKEKAPADTDAQSK